MLCCCLDCALSAARSPRLSLLCGPCPQPTVGGVESRSRSQYSIKAEPLKACTAAVARENKALGARAAQAACSQGAWGVGGAAAARRCFVLRTPNLTKQHVEPGVSLSTLKLTISHATSSHWSLSQARINWRTVHLLTAQARSDGARASTQRERRRRRHRSIALRFAASAAGRARAALRAR